MAHTVYGEDIVSGVGGLGTGQVLLKENSSFIVCGRSGSGKTTFISKMLWNASDMFENKLEREIEILYCYSSYQNLFNEMDGGGPIWFHKGLPDGELLSRLISPNKKHLIMVVDDLMREVVASHLMFDFFTVRAHHEGTSVIYVSHNLFQQGRFSKAISVNASYFCLFQNPRGADQIMTLGRQMFPNRNDMVVQAYELAMKVQKYGYLFLDMTANVPQALRLRTCIFPNEVCRFYALGTSE